MDSDQDYTLGLSRSGTEEWWLKTYTDGRFAIHENGVGDKVTIKAGGNVGIGTTNPVGKFHSYISANRQIGHNAVGGDLGVISDNNSAPVLYVKGTGTADLVNIFDDTTEVFTILDGGNVGIGTTSPGAKLDVTTNHQAQTAIRVTHNNYNDYVLLKRRSDDTQKLGIKEENSNGSMGLFTADTTRVTITSAGNVGIGTTSPSSKLDIDGGNTGNSLFVNGYVSGSAYGISDRFVLKSATRLWFYDSNTQIYRSGTALKMYGDDGVIFETNSNERMRIHSNGNISVGTTNAYARFSVKATSHNNGISVNRQADTTAAIYIGNNGGNNPVLAANNADMLFGRDVSGTFTERMRLTNGGNLGIGTTSPGVKLHVNSGSVRAEGNATDQFFFEGVRTGVGTTIRIYDNANTAYIDSYNNMAFRANQNGGSGGSFRFTGGNVGIGTTSPAAKLNVSTSSLWGTAVTDAITIDNTGSAGDVNSEHSLGRIRWRTNGVIGASIDAIRDTPGAGHNVDIAFSTNTGGSGTSTVERMRINYNGNVGIGTTSPSNTLDVNGGAEINGETYIRSTSNVGLRIQTTDQGIGGNDGLRVGLNATHAFVWQYENKPLAFATNGGQRMTISAGGNVGIGTTSPAYKLDVNGTMRIAGNEDATNLRIAANLATVSGTAYQNYNELLFENTGATYGNAGIRHLGNAWFDSKSALAFFTSSNTGSFDERMRITSSGNVGIGTTSPGRTLSVETNDTATYSASVNASEISIARKNSSNTAGQVAAISLNATGWSGQTTGVVVLNAIARQGNFSNADFAIQNRVGGNFVETFRITTYGNVGIGTDTPDDNVNTGSYFKPDGGGRFLTVKDSAGSFIMLESSTTTDDDQIGGIYFNNTGGQADAHVHVAGIDAILHKHSTNDAFSGGDLRFFTKPSGSGINGPRMIILQNGSVGIGTTSPNYKLDVNGEAH